jgi:hypothetical protein
MIEMLLYYSLLWSAFATRSFFSVVERVVPFRTVESYLAKSQSFVARKMKR